MSFECVRGILYQEPLSRHKTRTTYLKSNPNSFDRNKAGGLIIDGVGFSSHFLQLTGPQISRLDPGHLRRTLCDFPVFQAGYDKTIFTLKPFLLDESVLYNGKLLLLKQVKEAFIIGDPPEVDSSEIFELGFNELHK